jgi:hypothetical protein
MTKRKLIDAIISVNPSARPEFLATFSERQLLQYLQHLEIVLDSRPSWRVYPQAMAG